MKSHFSPKKGYDERMRSFVGRIGEAQAPGLAVKDGARVTLV
ncbi:MAG: hypothetical protein NT028_06070 [candidate division Zixibacteria bacterium]|nr:hypothetical protein [candidate division Zixibacteria bacterium]